MNVLYMALKEFNVDENRVYLMGHSMGGMGAMYIGEKVRANVGGDCLPRRFRLAGSEREAEGHAVVLHSRQRRFDRHERTCGGRAA